MSGERFIHCEIERKVSPLRLALRVVSFEAAQFLCGLPPVSTGARAFGPTDVQLAVQAAALPLESLETNRD